MARTRRIGTPDAKNRGVLLDAAERLLREEGYAAVTSRRVADKAGLKPQLVHYYFSTMDHRSSRCFVAARRGPRVQAQALGSAQPLWALWRTARSREATALTVEFMALASHRKELRSEFAHYAHWFGTGEHRRLAQALRALRHGHLRGAARRVGGVRDQRLPRLVMETGPGMSAGHAERSSSGEQWLRRLEG